MKRSRVRTAAAVLVLGAGLVGAAAGQAAPITTQELLHQFNLVILGDLEKGSSVYGRAYVGGNLHGNRSAQFNERPNAPASDYDHLVVVGNVTGGGVNLQNGGNATVGGNVANSNFELNGHGTLRAGGSITANANQGTKLANQAVADPAFAARFPTDVATTVQTSSNQLAALAGTAATVAHNVLDLRSPAGQTGVTVFDVHGSQLMGGGIQLGLVDADMIIINVAGLDVSVTSNFLGGPVEAAANVLWNFFEAQTVHLATQFFGSILAPFAHVTNGNDVKGSVIAGSMAMNGQLHLHPFEGDLSVVPVPAALPLLLSGLLGLGALRRYRRKAA